jgi:hypothetical protein
MNGNALDVDRLQELLFMLRIWTPVYTSPSFSCGLTAEALLVSLDAVELREQKAAEVLARCSAESSAALAAMAESGKPLIEGRATLEEKAARHQELERIFNEIQQSATQGDNARRELNQARRLMNNARDAWLAEKTKFDQLETACASAMNRLEHEFVAVMSKEFDAANEFTRSFLHWQRLWAYHSRS